MQASGPPAASYGAAYLWGGHSCLRPRPARHGSLPGQAVFVGHAFLWGRLSSLRPAFQPAWAPLTDCHSCAQSRPLPWSTPPGLPCRPLRGARSLACHTGSHAGGRLSSPALPQAPVCAPGSSCGARLVMWGRLSSLRPAFQPAWAPFTHRPLLNPMPCLVGADQRVRPLSSLPRRPFRWSMPPGLPCRRSRRQSHTIPKGAGVPTPSALPLCARLLMWGKACDVEQDFQPALAPFTRRNPSSTHLI